MQQFRGKNKRNAFSSFFLSSGWLSESLPNFSSVTSKAIMYKRYKNASLSKILLTDYHSSPTQWSSVLLFISWAAVGGNIFRKVSTILFSFQIHFLRVFFKHTAFVMFVKISCFISCFHAFIFCQARSASPLKSIMLGFFGSIEVTSFPWEDTFFD